MIKAILLDLDGTLVESEEYYLKGTFEFMKSIGFKGDLEMIIPIIGNSMQWTFNYLASLVKGYSAKDIEMINDKYFHEDNPIKYNEIIFKDVKNNLKKFKELNIKLALCSQSDEFLLKRFIKECELEDYFDFIISSESIKEAKPKPDIYLIAADKLGVNKKECIIVEDSVSGIMAGLNAGIFTIARKAKISNIDQSKADLIVENFDEIYKYVININNNEVKHD